ncbi:MAG TPA: alpha/beta fold hydrolase, partial [Leptolinea sp.]
GTSPQDLSKIHFKDWLDAADIAFAFLKEKSVDIVVGGESMGGLLALYLAANRPEIKGILLFAPALKSAGILKARIMKSFIFASPKKNLAATLPGFLPWQGYLVNPLKAVAELGNLQNQVRNLLPQVQQPVLIFQGKQDETIDPESSTTIFNSISSINKELIELNNCGHCVLLDIQHLLVYRKSVSFLTSLINSDTGYKKPFG